MNKGKETIKVHLNLGFFIAIGVVLLFSCISLITFYQKEWFVTETGNIKVVGPITLLMGVLMLFKFKWAKILLTFVVTISMIGSMVVVFVVDSQFRIPLIILSLGFFLIWFLLKS